MVFFFCFSGARGFNVGGEVFRGRGELLVLRIELFGGNFSGWVSRKSRITESNGF